MRSKKDQRMSKLAANNCKIFGTSVYQLLSDAYGKPLLDVPLSEKTLSLIEDAFNSHDFAKLGQYCGLLLQRIIADTMTRRTCLEHAKAFKSSAMYAECYAQLNTGLVVLTYGALEELKP